MSSASSWTGFIGPLVEMPRQEVHYLQSYKKLDALSARNYKIFDDAHFVACQDRRTLGPTHENDPNSADMKFCILGLVINTTQKVGKPAGHYLWMLPQRYLGRPRLNRFWPSSDTHADKSAMHAWVLLGKIYKPFPGSLYDSWTQSNCHCAMPPDSNGMSDKHHMQ